MASINKITEILAAIKTLFPYYGQEINVKYAVKLWNGVLSPYDDKEVDLALISCLQHCKHPPAPADMVEAIEEIKSSLRPNIEECWSNYTAAVDKASRLVTCFNYTALDLNGLSQGDNARNKCNELWESLDEEIRLYLGSYGEFMRRAYESAMGENMKYERDKFLKYMPEIRKTVSARQNLTALLNSAEINTLT